MRRVTWNNNDATIVAPTIIYIYIWEKTLQKISTRAKFEKKEEEKKIIQPNVFQYEKKGKM